MAVVYQIPKIIYPFQGEYPVSFLFGFLPRDEEIKKKYKKLGLSGHTGVDFALPEGTEIIAVNAGKIIFFPQNGDLGITVLVEHKWGQSLYSHLSKSLVKTGEKVKKGEVIGLSGKTGFTKGAHLHFGIKPKNSDEKNGYAGFIDPFEYLKK